MAKLRVLIVVLLSTLGALAADPDSVPPPRKAPTDKSEYRRLVLDNGVRVLLCTDPKLNLSSAALAIDAGSLDDPAERPGLAHFLEHMLFLGTEKYPNEADYRSYIKTNGGEDNGFTGSASTVYPFTIRHEAFEGALDRFAQFFIAPLLDPGFTEREINAVHNEAKRYTDDDDRRIARVQAEVSHTRTPQHQFSTGDRETLAGITREELLAFFRGHYVSERMALVLRSTHSLDQLESWARQYFSTIPRGAPAPLNRPRDFLPCADAPPLLRIEPLQEIRRLELQFITDSSQPRWDAKTPALLGKLLGYEGEGSLLAALKAEGLATALSAGGDPSVPSYDNFAISIELTPEGLAHTDRVLAMVFAQIELLRRSPFPLQTFHESAQLARLDETWRERGEGLIPTADLAANALRYPLAIAERIPFLWLTPDEAGYRRLLADLRPGNMLATLVARGVATDREEHHYKVKYGFDSAGMPPRSLLEDPPQVATLHLPRPNPFQPGEVALLPLEPAQLVAEPGLSLYHLQDTEFQRPLVTYVIRIRPERQILSAQDRVLSFFYQSCVLESANLVAYDAQQAGAEFDLTVDADGISLIVTGFSGSAEKCLAYFADQLRHFALDATRFAALKERTQRHLESFDRAEAVQQAAARRQALAQQFAFVPDHLAPLVATVDYSGIQAFGRSLLAHARVEALVYGNINGAAAIAGTRAFVATIGSAPPAGPVLSRQAHLVQQAGDSIVDSAAIRGSNSCCWREYEYPDDTPERRAAALLIGQFLAEPFFTELRTQQQLGYRVESQHQVDRHKLLQLLIVQSADYVPAELEKRICAFETTIGERWRSLGPEQFAVLAAGVRSTLEAKDKSGRERAERLFDLAYNFDAEWARTEATLRELEKLTPARVGETLAALFDPGSARLREVLLAGESHRGEKLPPPTFTDREVWKKTQAYR